MFGQRGADKMSFLNNIIIPNDGVANIRLGDNINIMFNKLDKLGYEISDMIRSSSVFFKNKRIFYRCLFQSHGL